MYLLGADVSKWQGKINFQTMREGGAEFVFIRASQGKTTDTKFQENRAGAKVAGLQRGFYHFLVWHISGKEQADYFWNLIKDDSGELAPVVDFEPVPRIPTPSNASEILKEFLQEIEILSGKIPTIYTGAFFWQEHGGDDITWGRYGLWVGSYTAENYLDLSMRIRLTPWGKWTFWQWTDRGDGKKFGAESKQIDLNYFNGTIEKLIGEKEMEMDETLENLLKEIDEKLDGLMDGIDQLNKQVEELNESVDRLSEDMGELIEYMKEHGYGK